MAEEKNRSGQPETEEQLIEEQVEQLEAQSAATAFLRDIVFICFLIAASIVLLVPSVKMWQKKPGWNAPGMFPVLTTSVMLLSALVSLVQVIRRRGERKTGIPVTLKTFLGAEIPLTVFVMMIATVLYVIGMGHFSFYFSTFAYLVFSILFLYGGNRQKILTALLVAAGADLAVWVFIEKLFQIRMP